MKIFSTLLLILTLLVFVSYNKPNCPSDNTRSYVIGDYAKVISGFYQGYTGTIIGMKSNEQFSCVIPFFKVRLDLGDGIGTSDVYISQYALYVVR